MRKYIFITIIIAASLSSCEPKYENPFRDDIIGKWKLVKISIGKDYQDSETIDYSDDNIIYDFQPNNTLVVSGVIIDTLSLFECFKEGEHFYKYSKYPDPPSCPGPNLIIDADIYEYKPWFFCDARKDKQTMAIGCVDSKEINGEYYRWSKEFVIIK